MDISHEDSKESQSKCIITMVAMNMDINMAELSRFYYII